MGVAAHVRYEWAGWALDIPSMAGQGRAAHFACSCCSRGFFCWSSSAAVADMLLSWPAHRGPLRLG